MESNYVLSFTLKTSDVLFLSKVVSSVICFVYITRFFLTTTSSLTYGVFVASPTSFFLTGIVKNSIWHKDKTVIR